MSLRIAIALSCMISAPAAQISVSVEATNDAGVTLVRSATSRAVQNLPSSTSFTKFTRAEIKSQAPYTALQSFVYPPFRLGSLVTNRVKIATAFQLRKGSGYSTLHTTALKTGAPGTQRYRVRITTTKSTPVNVDWNSFCSVYDSSKVNLKLTLGSFVKTWTRNAPGVLNESGAVQLLVNGTVFADVEVNAETKPGTGSNGNATYEGFSASLTLNVLKIEDGSFKTFGSGCSQGKIASNGVPVRGSPFEIKLVGDKPNTHCLLLFGLNKDSYGSLSLPAAYGASGCFLNVGMSYPWNGITDAAGDASLRTWTPVFLPKSTFYVQWLVVGGPKVSDLTLTKGAEVKF